MVTGVQTCALPIFQSRMAGYQTAIQNGILTRNEVRVLEDRNPLPGLDEVLTPLNMAGAPNAQPGTRPANEGAGIPSKADIDDSKPPGPLGPFIADLAERIAGAELVELAKHVRFARGNGLERAGFAEWAAIHYGRLATYVRGAAVPVADASGIDGALAEMVERIVRDARALWTGGNPPDYEKYALNRRGEIEVLLRMAIEKEPLKRLSFAAEAAALSAKAVGA